MVRWLAEFEKVRLANSARGVTLQKALVFTICSQCNKHVMAGFSLVSLQSCCQVSQYRRVAFVLGLASVPRSSILSTLTNTLVDRDLITFLPTRKKTYATFRADFEPFVSKWLIDISASVTRRMALVRAGKIIKFMLEDDDAFAYLRTIGEINAAQELLDSDTEHAAYASIMSYFQNEVFI